MIPPVEIADAIELWARQRGRHARLFWQPILRCWCIELELRGDDPRLKKYQAGEIAWKPTESVPLHEWDAKLKRYVAIDLEQWGPSGIVERLNKADLLSGRGEHNTLAEALQAVERQNQDVRDRMHRAVEDAGREAGWLAYPLVAGRPIVTVDHNLEEEGAEHANT